jgi:protocatechuate 3,4-dioxygenase beta subunit
MVNPTQPRSPSATTSEQITESVLTAVQSTPDPRIRQITAALVRHLHDLAREVRLQPEELLAAADFLKGCGEISDASRHEFILLSDVLGLTMVVDTLAADPPDGALETSVLGPFYRAGAPLEPNGADISRGDDDGEPAHIFGRVLDTDGRPLAGAELDVWGTNHNGLYENVDPNQPDFNLRGRFHTDTDGRYDLWTVKPVSYPIPDDGPVGDLLRATARNNMRPGHLHIIVSADGYRTVITELYSDDDPYLDTDVVFGVKPSLTVHYDQVADADRTSAAQRTEPHWELRHDLVLTPGDRTSVGFSTGREESS